MNRVNRLMLPSALMMTICAPAYTQERAPKAPVPATSPAIKPSVPAPIVAPQVNPVVHRLNGLKMLSLLRRYGFKVAPLNDELLISDAIQTSIAAGLSLEDGSIVVRLPRAELEIPMVAPFAPSAAGKVPNESDSASNLFIVQRDGKEQSLRFVGLDGGTGLSLLRAFDQRKTAPVRDAKEETLALGQRVRLMSPGRATEAVGLTLNELFVNITELEGNLTGISRSPSGSVTQLIVRADKLSPANVGGVAINDAGETIGLVESSNGSEAHVIPVAGIRRAVERIRLRLERKPQPWLGARGMSLSAVSREQLEGAGWKRGDAMQMMGHQVGVVLTSVPPDTPAWMAKLRVGDVVTRVNGGEVKSAEDFSSKLSAAVGEAPVRFTVLAPHRRMPRSVNVKLNLSLDPVLEMEGAEDRAARLLSTDPLVARGMETLPITARLATHLKAIGGRLVVFVHPNSAAARAGMLAGDVIESVNNKLLVEESIPIALPPRMVLDVVRKGEKLKFQIEMDLNTPATRQN